MASKFVKQHKTGSLQSFHQTARKIFNTFTGRKTSKPKFYNTSTKNDQVKFCVITARSQSCISMHLLRRWTIEARNLA